MRELTRLRFGRKIASAMPTGFDEAFRRVKEPVADFGDNATFYLPPEYQAQESRHNFVHNSRIAFGCDGLDRQIDALVYDLYTLAPAEIKIVEGVTK